MFWLDTDFKTFEQPIFDGFKRMFIDYPRIVTAISSDLRGPAVASHMIHRLRYGGNENLNDYNLENEYEAMLNAINRTGSVDWRSCFSPRVHRYDSPQHLITGNSRLEPTQLEGFEQAVALIKRTSFSYIVERMEQMACVIIGEQCFPETNQSYTLQDVRMTIYTDLYAHQILTAESIIHEHAHMTFNNYSFDRPELWESAPLYYSPWKEKKRPLFNFVHSLMAFSEVVAFIREIAEFEFDEKGRRYIDMKLSFEKRNLESVQEPASKALKQMGDRYMVQRIERAMANALGAV